MISLILLGLIAVASAQDVVQVDCAQDAIVIRLEKGVVNQAGFTNGDIHLNDNACAFDEEDGDFFVRRVSPFTACGTSYTTNDTHVVYKNSLSTVDTGANYPYGVVVGSMDNVNVLSALISCTYNIDLRVSTMFIPNITVVYIPLPDAYGEGEFQAAMSLYTDERYASPYTTPPTMPADSTLFVGVTLLGQSISTDIYLLMERCWATVFEDPDSMPQYPLIDDGCALSSASEGTVKVTQNGDGHQGLWQSAVFKFVGSEPEYNQVWLHCDLQLCVQDSCEPVCDARRKRRSAFLGDGRGHTVTLGPVSKSVVEITMDLKTGITSVVIPNNTVLNPSPSGNTEIGGMSPALLITTGALAALCVVCITVAVVLIALRMQRNSRNAEMTNSGNINKGFNT